MTAATSAGGTGTPHVPQRAVLLRGLDILDCFDSRQPVLGVTTIAARTGLPPATVYRLLTTLREWGAVERVDRGRYRLGLKLWRLGSAAPQVRQLRDAALPFLEDLYEATHAVVHLAVRDGHDTLYIEKISGRGAVPVASCVGRRLPLHATGPGKVLLAYGPPGVFDDLVAAGLDRLACGTITDPGELRRTLAAIRTTGHAVSRQEASDSTASVAAPVFGPTGTAVASISVVTPLGTFTPLAFVPAVRAVARAVSRALDAPGRSTEKFSAQ
ncbi:IclR family transcriptional regulator [Streptomyces sp. NPDC056716]|uniref:IclR family transcriptional regulator n=1 Tax=unclassified Streptomyces TaxID=2593676 RepID=UPI0036BF0A9F